ncbi:MAG: hypothetical protein JJT75_01065 [Opitutales bacterium]|nr:hypothetical protein [Opitutales bacterium]
MNLLSPKIAYLIFALGFLSLFGSVAIASIQIPRQVYRVADFEEATARAERLDRPIALVLSNENTSCGLVVHATETAFRSLGNYTVVVFLQLNDAERAQKIPPNVFQAFQAKEAGRIIPKVVIASSDLRSVLGIVSYEDMKDNRTWQNVRREVSRALSSPENLPEQAKVTRWYSVRGEVYRGDFFDLTDTHLVILRDTTKAERPILLENLSPATIAYARFVKESQEAKEKEVEEAPELVFERWTSKDNSRQIEGAFLSLQDNQVQLKTPDGEDLVFSIDLMNEESQKRAKKLAQKP